MALFSSCNAFFPIHQCEQGHRCVYYRGGSLLSQLSNPGYQLKIPLITYHHNVQVTWQTDTLHNVVCGSSQGGQAYLDIDVVNKLSSSDKCILKVVGEHTVNYDKPLIFDYIPSEVAQFCKNYTLDDIVIREFDKLDEVLLEKLRDNIESYRLSDCLEIKKVRINRPKLDDAMRKRFESIENEQKVNELAIRQKETERAKLETQLQKEMMEKASKDEGDARKDLRAERVDFVEPQKRLREETMSLTHEISSLSQTNSNLRSKSAALERATVGQGAELKQLKALHNATVQQLLGTRDQLREEQVTRRRLEADIARYRGAMHLQQRLDQEQ